MLVGKFSVEWLKKSIEKLLGLLEDKTLSILLERGIRLSLPRKALTEQGGLWKWRSTRLVVSVSHCSPRRAKRVGMEDFCCRDGEGGGPLRFLSWHEHCCAFTSTS